MRLTSPGQDATASRITRLEYGAEHLTADTGSTRGTVGHYTFTCTNDCHAETAAHQRNLAFVRVVAKTWTAGTVKLSNYWLTFEVLELDYQLRLAAFLNGIV